MILISHLLVGAAIASNIQFAPLALFLALLSHYLLDVFPQHEYSIKNIKSGRWNKSFWEFVKVFIDISFGIFLILLFSENTVLIFAAAFIAIVPDGFTLLTVVYNKNKLLNKHQKIHHEINEIPANKKFPMFWKIFAQVLVGLIAIIFLL